MHFFIQTTLIHQVMNNITIIRSRFNQNRNNLITNLTVHLDDICMMVCMYVIQHYIDARKALTNIPNSLCLMCTIYLRPITLILQTISPTMIFAISATLYRLPTCILVFLLRSKSLSFVRCIEILRWRYILFITCTLRSCSLLVPFSFVLCITFPV